MIVGPTALVKSEEEDGVFPRWTDHQRVDKVRDVLLPGQNRLAGAWVLVIVAIAGFDECEAGKRVIVDVGEVDRKRGYVVRVDAVRIRVIPHHTGWLRRSNACRTAGILVEVLE